MHKDAFFEHLSTNIAQLKNQNLYKTESVIHGPQSPLLNFGTDQHYLNFCSNNYLGLANHPDMIKAATQGMHDYGFGMSSVRFICGTQGPHKLLEHRIASFLKHDDSILYSSCFDANTGLFETLLGPEDAIISDALNHACIIDGIRLCKAQRFIYKHRDLKSLQFTLEQAASCRFKLIVTDGVFSMDGTLAPLPDICDLAEQHGALVMIDDSHGIGVLGATGRGTAEHFGLLDHVDIITGTLGKALGGASGGFTCARQVLIDYLRQKSRPYLFSNALAPGVVLAGIKAIDLIENDLSLVHSLQSHCQSLRSALLEQGVTLSPFTHAIIPIMLHETKKAVDFAQFCFEKGVFVIPFSYPVVPQGQARVRLQVSAAFTLKDIASASAVFGDAYQTFI